MLCGATITRKVSVRLFQYLSRNYAPPPGPFLPINLPYKVIDNKLESKSWPPGPSDKKGTVGAWWAGMHMQLI